MFLDLVYCVFLQIVFFASHKFIATFTEGESEVGRGNRQSLMGEKQQLCPSRQATVPCQSEVIICKYEFALVCGQPFILGQLIHLLSVVKRNPAQEFGHFS